MSFSFITSFEACPKQWQLVRASYDDLWEGNGYPPKLFKATIAGEVVHFAVEKILTESRAVTGDFADQLVGVLKKAGGLSKIIDGTVDEVLNRHAKNPRASQLLAQFDNGRLLLPDTVRVTIQSILQSLSAAGLSRQSNRTKKAGSRGALGPGLYSEITLEAKDANWIGQVDLLLVTEEVVAMEDIKTGDFKSLHESQIKTYAWLWRQDKRRNPYDRPIKRLTLRYPFGARDVPVPDDAENSRIGEDLAQRTKAILGDIENGHFEARPAEEQCRFCSVRHLCDTYWDQLASVLDDASPLQDLEATIVSVVSKKTCHILVTKGISLPTDNAIILRGELPSYLRQVGTKIRILDSRVFNESGESPDHPTVYLCSGSEAYGLLT